jgi:hypothetical protein
MKTVIHKFLKEEKGVSVVIGAMLMLLIVAAMWGTTQAFLVPGWNKDVEYEHLNTVHDDMMTFKSDVEDVAISGEPKSSNFHMGVRYPNRMFLANPGTGVAGSLTSENISISIVYTIDAPGDPVITQTYSSNRISYEVQGTIDRPKLVYEHGVIIKDYGNAFATTDEQALIVGDEIFIPVLTGNLTASSSMETESIALRALFQSPGSSKLKSVVITLDTLFPEVWVELLAGTSTADTIVAVDLVQSKIVISSNATRQIFFPWGDINIDALFAGMVSFSTQYTTSALSTSVDIGQDYPRIMDIAIVAPVSGSALYKQTHSTITATVKNATAPYDISADLTALTNDPASYAVIPDSSSNPALLITATSWTVPTENTTVSWTNFTHLTAVQNEGYVITFRVTNTVNHMQYVVSRVFVRHGNVSWQ